MFIIGSFYPTFFVDRVGRRQPMMWGALGLAISMMMIAILLSFKGTSIEKQTSSAAVTFFFTYMLIFGGSINCVPWVYVPEILPLHARAKGTAIGVSGNWIWNFFVVMITPIILTRLAWKAYLIFMCTNFAFIPLVYFCYPETANLTLEEIDYIFIDETKGAVKLSKEMRRERVKGRRRESFVQPDSRTGSFADGILVEGGQNATKSPHKESAAKDGDQFTYAMAEHAEKSEPKVNSY